MKKIPLTRGKFAIVDDEDFELVNKYKWHAQPGGLSTKNFYAQHNIFNKEIWKKYKKNRSINLRMHNLILPPPKGMIIDHINHNGLDNRKSNLRICTMKENWCNQPTRKSKQKYKGITKVGNRFHAQISKNGKKHWHGGFETEKEAALAYNELAKKIHGKFANLNEIS